MGLLGSDGTPRVKLAVLGGGGFRVPLVYRALLRDRGEPYGASGGEPEQHASPRVDEVALHDESPERLGVMGSVLAQQADGHPDPPTVHTTTELDTALAGADFVFAAIRVGGLAGRVQDERVALRCGVLGQETTGPGGLAYGLRTIPVMRHIAERVRAVAPEAFVINFTNPAGMITEALRDVLGDRVIGICDTPGDQQRRVAAALGVGGAHIRADYVGLNHLGWLRRLLVNGRDRLPELLADDHALGSLTEGRIFGPSWLRALGAIPNEYLYYYYCTADAVRSIGEQPGTRGEFLWRQQDAFYRAAARDPNHALRLWQRAIAEREATYMAEAHGEHAGSEPTRQGSHEPDAKPADASGEHPVDPVDPGDEAEAERPGGYEAVALAVMAAIAGDERSTMIVNVANRGTVAGLPDDAVVEVPALVDAGGAHPLVTPPPDLHQLGLMQQLKAVERLVIEAATTGSRQASRQAARQAFALHPLVDSVSTADRLLDAYVDACSELAFLRASTQ